jgi:hypothetical protein
MVNRILLITTLLGACSHDSGPSENGVVGPSGGTVAAGQSASVALPAGALSSNTTITVTPTEATPPTSTVAVGTPYLFGPEGTQFAVPVTVTLEFSPSLLPTGMSAGDVVVYTAPANTTDYQPLTTSIVDATHVSAQTTHFSIFVGAVRPHEGSGADAGVANDAGASVDAGVAIDAATSIDAGSVCTLSGTGGGAQQCVITSTCNAHYYSATCTDLGTSGSYCWCHVDNQPQQYEVTNVPGSCSSANGQPGWGACGFP